MVCEVSDRGGQAANLAIEPPTATKFGGRGLWLAHLADTPGAHPPSQRRYRHDRHVPARVTAIGRGLTDLVGPDHHDPGREGMTAPLTWRVDIQTSAQRTLVTLSGEIDIGTVDQLSDLLRAAIRTETSVDVGLAAV